MNVYAKDRNQTRKHENKIGLVFQEYYTNQKSFAHLSLEVKIIFEFIKNLCLVWPVGISQIGS